MNLIFCSLMYGFSTIKLTIKEKPISSTVFKKSSSNIYFSAAIVVIK